MAQVKSNLEPNKKIPLFTNIQKNAFTQASIIFILLLAMFLRFYTLDAQSLWSDEGNSLALSQTSFSQIAARTAYDIHPPLYYWLLKIWVTVSGTSEFSARSLSALLGVLVVVLTYRLGTLFFSREVGLTAAFLGAITPFQIYYAQEARMYMLMMALACLCVWLAGQIFVASKPSLWLMLAYSVCVAGGLYTQYTFPTILAVINLGALGFLWAHKSRLGQWIAWQFVPLLLYLPWLPTAYRQITTWPSLMESASLSQISLTIFGYLSLGLSYKAVSNWWMGIFALVLMLGVWHSWQKPRLGWPAGLLMLGWLILPITLILFLYRPAYLKFLLMASPAYTLLLGLGLTFWTRQNAEQQIFSIQRRKEAKEEEKKIKRLKPLAYIFSTLLLLLLLAPTLQSLQATYFAPAYQRDNYRAITTYLESVATTDDAIIIHAPGQQEVFNYYYDSSQTQTPVYALPQQRPLNPSQTLDALTQIATQSKRIFSVYWATEEADPTGLIETWLNENTFKATDAWFGNVRFVRYATPTEALNTVQTNYQFENGISLKGYALSAQTLTPGQILQVQLHWQTAQAISENHTVFLQLLDEAQHVLGQRDAPPALPSTQWPLNMHIRDAHGLYLEPGTPPQRVQLVVGLYNAQTGQRLKLSTGQDFIPLTTLTVTQATNPLPAEALHIQHFLSQAPLLGYDLYKLGHASKLDTSLNPGDPVHLVLYWQKPSPLPTTEILDIGLINSSGERLSQWQFPLAGINYPLNKWQTGEIVRAQYTFFLGNIPPGKYALQFFLAEKEVALIDNLKIGEE